MLFESFPPEINSLLIISGVGSGPLWAASTAWAALAEDMEASATMVESVVDGMAVDWLGPTSAMMQAKLQPHVATLHTFAAQAADASARAAAQAAHYEQARNTLVPLPAVLANRAAWMAAISTNILGINSALIAMLEAVYDGMWAQDVMGMLNYQAASESTTPPPVAARTANAPTGGSSGKSQSQVASPTDQLVSGIESLGVFTQPVAQLWNQVLPVTNALNSVFQGVPILGPYASLDLLSATGLSNASELANGPMRLMSTPVSMLTSLTRGGSSGISGLEGATSGANPLLDAINELVTGKLTEMTTGLTNGLTNQLTSWGSQIGQQVNAQLASASRIGGLSVPEGAVQTITRALPVPPATTVSAATTVQAGMPGGPFGQAMMGALAGRGFGGLGTVAKAGAKAVTSAKGG